VVLFCFSIVILLLQKQTFHIVTYFFTCFFQITMGESTDTSNMKYKLIVGFGVKFTHLFISLLIYINYCY